MVCEIIRENAEAYENSTPRANGRGVDREGCGQKRLSRQRIHCAPAFSMASNTALATISWPGPARWTLSFTYKLTRPSGGMA
jgi:hypothetical protein